MKTVTMYELLGMIKDGKAPKKIKNINSIWEYDEDSKDYYSDDYNEYLIYSISSRGLIEREVEIIEEKKIPEKLKIEQTSNDNCCLISENGTRVYVTKANEVIIETLNQLIDYIESKEE